MKKSIYDRILERSTVNENGCWIWTKSLDMWGYSKISIGYSTRGAHRVSYEEFVGPIPEGLQLDHLCRTPACVNPFHLEPVTCRENLLRGDTFQARNALKKMCQKGHPYTPRSGGARYCKTCTNERRRVLS